MQTLPISKKGFEKARTKLDEIKRDFETLPAIIKTAREKGDLKENAEYHAARERQGMLNAEIQLLSSQITRSQILNPQKLPADLVTFGKTVSVEDLETNEKKVFTLVGPVETPYWENAISITTEVAKALLGKKKGEQVLVKVPNGEKKLRILEINVMQ